MDNLLRGHYNTLDQKLQHQSNNNIEEDALREQSREIRLDFCAPKFFRSRFEVCTSVSLE